ncbi:MAG: hypothetical protein J1E98_00355 [Lachnospiraceae bacterium]|nr:hypothetical protein [Lachnospiraceae bacterium]
MNSKKRLFLILGCCTLIVVITIMGIMLRESSSFQEREKANRYCIDDMDTNNDKDSLYFDYIVAVLVETIKNENGVMDCKINLNYSNGEIVSANVSVVAEGDEINISETNILDYVSQSLEISTEDIILSYD